MKKTISVHDFIDAFSKIRPDSFSYYGQKALFEYLEELETETGQEIELDVIALCCDYTEYEDLEEFKCNYGKAYNTIEDIEENTTVIRVGEEGLIVQAF